MTSHTGARKRAGRSTGVSEDRELFDMFDVIRNATLAKATQDQERFLMKLLRFIDRKRGPQGDQLLDSLEDIVSEQYRRVTSQGEGEDNDGSCDDDGCLRCGRSSAR